MSSAEERAQWSAAAAILRERAEQARRAGKWGKARQLDLEAQEAEAKAAQVADHRVMDKSAA